MPTPREYCVFDLLIKILGDDQHQEDTTMVELREALEVAVDNGDKVRVMEVLNDILEYAIAETDGDLVQRTIETIQVMKEEEIEMNRFNGEVKDLETGHIGNAFITDKGEEYLIEPYMVESDGEGQVLHRHYKHYVLSKELEGFEYEVYLQEEEEMKVEMNLQFFASKEEEEIEMLKQIEKFHDIAKTIEEIDESGRDVYVGGVKVSWDSVKQFIYGLDDEELKLLAYSNKPEIPAELEVFAIYLLEAEKAWDNELTLQNAYFNSKKHLSMNLQFFAKGGAKRIEFQKGTH